MNGEGSTDNWRKYKVVKVDSKKYINKVDMEPRNKDILSSDMTDKVIIAKDNDLKAKTIETSKVEIITTDRKKEESNLKPKENIAMESFNADNSDLEDEQQNRIPEVHQSIADAINALEDRNKCKVAKKCEKHYECDDFDKHDKCEKEESIEDAINRLGKKLDTYHGVIDFKINNMHEDMIIYGFIKDKNDCDCKWKKFNVETKCRNESQDFNNIQANSRRIEENFKLDKLNTTDGLDRLDIIDFDEYENEIQQAEKVSTSKLGNGTMNQTETMQQPKITMEQPKVTNGMEQSNSGNVQQQKATTQDFNITGEVGKYFEKIAEDFEPYSESLADINYCKLYKINVKSIEELSDDSNYNKYTLAYYPMLNYYPYISKEGYFLVGYKCNKDGEMKYIVYAIPGQKEKSCQPYGGRTGFVTWTTDNKNGKGYWLMFYDFKNSSIVIPTK